MKKRGSIGFLLVSIGCGLLVLSFLIPIMVLYGLTYGIAGGLIGCGILIALDFRKSNNESITRRAKQNIDLYDERKIMLREKSGRTTYIICLVGLVIYNAIIFLLENVGIDIEIGFVIFSLSMYIIFEYVLGLLVFRYYGNKY